MQDIIKESAGAETTVQEKNKYILVMLTKYPDTFSTIFRKVARWKYTHVSIGLEDTEQRYFSIVRKGFRVDDFRKHPTAKKQEVPCELYRIPVSDNVFEKVEEALEYHSGNSKYYKYSYFGLFLCMMRISMKKKNRYFCSQFVAEILEYAKVLNLGKHSSLFLPDDFQRISELHLVFKGTLKNLMNAGSLIPL